MNLSKFNKNLYFQIYSMYFSFSNPLAIFFGKIFKQKLTEVFPFTSTKWFTFRQLDCLQKVLIKIELLLKENPDRFLLSKNEAQNLSTKIQNIFNYNILKVSLKNQIENIKRAPIYENQDIFLLFCEKIFKKNFFQIFQTIEKLRQQKKIFLVEKILKCSNFSPFRKPFLIVHTNGQTSEIVCEKIYKEQIFYYKNDVLRNKYIFCCFLI